MSQELNRFIKTFIVGGSTITAGRVVKFTGTAVTLWDTETAFPLGISQDTYDPSTTASIILAGTVKAVADASIAVGAIIQAATNGNIVTKPAAGYTSTASAKVLGIALENASTNSVIEIFLARSMSVQA